jgi:alanine racemase
MYYDDLNSWIEISEAAYRHNIGFFSGLLNPQVELSVVVKANAYGHGLLQIASLAQKNGVKSFCVHSLEEALTLRENGFTQHILIMGHIPLLRLKEAIQANFRLVLFNQESLDVILKETKHLNESVRIHLKLETGTNRQGINRDELSRFMTKMKNQTAVILESVYTHFSNIEDTTNHEYALSQLERFREMVFLIQNSGFDQIKKHAACSASILLFPETHFDMVRLGISQYGLWPSRETFVSYKIKHTRNGENVLKPVLSWKTRIGQIKQLSTNQFVGYGCSYQTTRESKVAVLPIGYSDGYDRKLSNQGYVLIRGKRAPIRGRICMNMIMVDVTDIPEAKLEDEVVLIGKQGNEYISVDQLASLSGTINYEWISRINPHIHRLIVE